MRKSTAQSIRNILDRASEGRGDKWALIQIMNVVHWTPPEPQGPMQ